MNIIALGINHKMAPVEVRERLALDREKARGLFDLLAKDDCIYEFVLLSTCNRVEIYAGVEDCNKGMFALKSGLASLPSFPAEGLDKYLYAYSDRDAVRHLFRVSSSLDSMVVGEAQILGQVKDAYASAKSEGGVGVILNRLFEKAFTAAKRVRTETKIAENAVSISFVAVELAKKIFDDLSGRRFMIIGAGEMAEIAARQLIANGVKDIVVLNRTIEKGIALAGELNGRAVQFDDIEKELAEADIVISSINAPHLIINKEMVQRALGQRKNNPIFFIDISVPRNIDPNINDLDNVYIYDIDDLQSVVEANMREREQEALRGEEIVEHEADTFMAWLDTMEVTPTITAMRGKAEEIRQKEVAKALARLGDVSEETRQAIESMSSAIINKLLYGHTAHLKKRADSDERHWYVKVVRDIFKLD